MSFPALGGFWASTAAILVLFILLVIVSCCLFV